MDIAVAPAEAGDRLRIAEGQPFAARVGVERREQPRFKADSAAELLLGPLRFPCAVVDISASGAQLVISERVAALSPATLRIIDIGALHCRIVWTKGERTGIRFLHEPNWVKARVGQLFKAT